MQKLPSHDAHALLGATFGEINGQETVLRHGDVTLEHRALMRSAAVIDLSHRSRLVLTGADRVRYLHSQCTNDIARLEAGHGCYTAFTNNKGKLDGDANVFLLDGEILLDAEPGQTADLTKRLQQFIVADDVEIVDATPLYGTITVQGPRAREAIDSLALGCELPTAPFANLKVSHAIHGTLYLANNPRLRVLDGYDLFVPVAALGNLFTELAAAAGEVEGRAAGMEAFEVFRIEQGLPRYGVDMDGSNIASEAGIADRAINYQKGCYVGQEVLNRIRSLGQVTKSLRGLFLADHLDKLPEPGARLFRDGRPIGYITSAIESLKFDRHVALGYVRKEHNQTGTVLKVEKSEDCRVVDLPFTEECFEDGPAGGKAK